MRIKIALFENLGKSTRLYERTDFSTAAKILVERQMEIMEAAVDKIVSESDLSSITRKGFLARISEELGAESVEQNKEKLLELMGASVTKRLQIDAKAAESPEEIQAAPVELPELVDACRRLVDAGKDDLEKLSVKGLLATLAEQYGKGVYERKPELKEAITQRVSEVQAAAEAEANKATPEQVIKRALEIAASMDRVNPRKVISQLGEEFGDDLVKDQKREIRRRLQGIKDGDDVGVMEEDVAPRKRRRTPAKPTLQQEDVAMFFQDQGKDLQTDLFGDITAAGDDVGALETFFDDVPDAEDQSEDEYVPTRRKSKKKKRRKQTKKQPASKASPKRARTPEPEKPKTYSEQVFHETSKTMSARTSRKANTLPREQVLQEVAEVLERMNSAFDRDLSNNRAGKPATARLQTLSWALSQINREYLIIPLIEGGLLTTIARWLAPLPDRTLPSHRVRTDVLNALHGLSVEWSTFLDKLKSSQLGKVVSYLSRHDEELPANKLTCQKLIQKWSRDVFLISDDYRGLQQTVRRSNSTIMSASDRAKKYQTEQALKSKNLEIRRTSKSPKSSRAAMPYPESREFHVRPVGNIDQQAEKPKASRSLSVKDAKTRFQKDLASRNKL